MLRIALGSQVFANIVLTVSVPTCSVRSWLEVERLLEAASTGEANVQPTLHVTRSTRPCETEDNFYDILI